jgi:murein L,D-transpeptidase YafK
VYAVKRAALNPQSSFHLSFNIGYPNAYDAARGRTGSHIMVHGSDVSVGCFAMTDAVIEEIYLLVEAALKAGQAEVPVLCFPFRFGAERLARAETKRQEQPWVAFWREELGPIDAAFEQNKRPPRVRVGAEPYAVVGSD